MKEYTKDGFVLKRFLPSDWQVYKSIRLEALQTNPEMFGSSYLKESQYDDTEWQSILLNEERGFFGLYDGQEIIGVTGTALVKEDKTQAVLIASFIRPEYRGMGLSALFYEARLDWAREQHCQSVIVSHRVDNVSSMKANQRSGFVYTHSKLNDWPDGVTADQLYYKLDL